MKKRYVLLAAVVGGLIAISFSLPRASSRPQVRETLEGIAKETGLRLPASSRIVGVRRERGIDDYAAIKLEIAAADEQELLSSFPVDPTTMRRDAIAYFGTDRGFWDPNAALGFRGAQFRSDTTFRTLNLGVSAPQRGLVTVYIVSHGQ